MISTAAIADPGEDICHFGGIRIRVNGSGNLIPSFYSLDNVQLQVLAPIAMQSVTPIQPFRLANFVSQRVFLRLETTQINDIFKINRIIIFAKAIYSQYPNG